MSITSSQNPAPREKQDRRNNSYSKEHDSVGEVRERARGERRERETTARDEKACTILLVDFLHDRICVLEAARACEEVRGHDVARSLESARDVETFIDRCAGEKTVCRGLCGTRRMVECDERRIKTGERGTVSAGKVRCNPLAAPAPKRRLGSSSQLTRSGSPNLTSSRPCSSARTAAATNPAAATLNAARLRQRRRTKCTVPGRIEFACISGTPHRLRV